MSSRLLTLVAGLLFLPVAPWPGVRAAESSSPPVAAGPPDQPLARADRNSQLAHEQLVAKARQGGIDVYFVGDSITRRWGATDYPELLAHWTTNFFGWNAGNFGWGADRTENILWRLEHGELDGVNPNVIVVLAGINNVGNVPGDATKVEAITRGIEAIVRVCQTKAPGATVILTALFPRNDNLAVLPEIERINTNLARMADGKRVRWLNVNDRLADRDGRLFPGMTHDQLHPTLKGYQVWADGLKPMLAEILGPPAATDHAPPPTGDPSAKRPALASLQQVFAGHFWVGTAVSRAITTGTGFRRSPEQVQQDIALVQSQFNQVVAENEMKWALIHPRPGPEGYDFKLADAFVEFGQSNRMELAGHTLVWHSQTPHWVFAGTNPPPAGATNAAPSLPATPEAAGTNRAGRGRFGPGLFGPYTGPRASREELLGRMEEHIRTVVGRYKGRIKVWDVVNEALADRGTNVLRNSLWFEIIGPDYLAKAFQFAHEADPDAILRYNDYGLENPDKRRKLITLIRSLQAQHVPVHAIGSQAHVDVGITFATMDAALAEIATLGLPIHITELDVNGARGGQGNFGADIASNAATTGGGLVSDADRKLSEAYAGLFRAFLKHDAAVELVTFWGPNDANSWRAAGRPLLFDANNQAKPAFHAVIAEAHPAKPNP